MTYKTEQRLKILYWIENLPACFVFFPKKTNKDAVVFAKSPVTAEYHFKQLFKTLLWLLWESVTDFNSTEHLNIDEPYSIFLHLDSQTGLSLIKCKSM